MGSEESCNLKQPCNKRLENTAYVAEACGYGNRIHFRITLSDKVTTCDYLH